MDDAARAALFRRSYQAVDGLWFMKVEERLGFEGALDVDAAVWAVFAKIQAREMQRLLGAESGLAALAACLTTKLALEGHAAESELSADGRRLVVRIHECPWRELMRRSGREHLASAVGRCICAVEFGTWAAEFGPGIAFTLEGLACAGAECCTLIFQAADDAAR